MKKVFETFMGVTFKRADNRGFTYFPKSKLNFSNTTDDDATNDSKDSMLQKPY